MQMYQGIRPAVYLSYEREAFYGRDDHELRITFDQNILWRTTQLDLSAPVYGRPLLEKNQALMEIKVGQGGPGMSDMQPPQDAGTENGGNSETQNSSTTEDISTKGIKTGGDLLLKDGTFMIDSCDDSLHTNGNLSICGGTYTLSTGDDGMHADGADQVYAERLRSKRVTKESKDRIWKSPMEPSISQPAMTD